LENIKEVIVKFEGRISIKVRRQEKLDIVEERERRITRKLYDKHVI